jgi:hypothetical protein
MPINGEKIRHGRKELAQYMGISERKALGLKAELVNCGAIFYMRIGKPPKRRMCFWPSEIRKWTRLKSAKGSV